MELIIGENSYMTLEEANRIVEDNFMSSDSKRIYWENLKDNDKSILIYRATQKIDVDGMIYKGRKADISQKMQFPRIISDHTGAGLMEFPDICKVGIVMLALKEVEYNNSEEVKLLEKGVTSYKIKDASITLDTSFLNKVKGIDNNIFYEFFSQYSMIC